MSRESKTTTVGLIAGDYVVLAADKRATGGPTVYHKRVRKILKITDYAAMTISGLVADAQFLVDEARYIARMYEIEYGRKIKIFSLANYMSLILSAYLRYAPFIVQLLVGGVDEEGPSLYYLDLYGSISREKYASTGSGSPVALGVLEREYRDGLSLEEAKKIAFKAVEAAVARDGFSGEGVDIVVIGPGYYSEETLLFEKKLVTK
ncbi:proteasome subunit beta [Thermogladius sp. 4427co]|uniref:proteasome subunit beta n=1 Tax=Thermogladius sp. 4427co TaxID=3450718 RepID=UPI003F7AA6A2